MLSFKQSQAFLFVILTVLFCAVTESNAASVSKCSRPIKMAVDTQSNNASGTQKNISGMLFSFFSEVEKLSSCKIAWEIVPRARGLHYFQNGMVDLMYAVQTTERDKWGNFLSLIEFYPSLIVMKAHLKSNSPADILEQNNLMFNFVRGFDYGPDYHRLIANLKSKNQFEEVPDADTIARKMRVGRVHATVMSATLFAHVAESEQIDRQIESFTLTNFNKLKAGVYISKKTLKSTDEQIIRNAVVKVAAYYDFHKYFQSNYPAWAIKGIQTKEAR
jgi:hypothetical protein